MKDLKKKIADLENQLLDKGCFVNVEIGKPISKTKLNAVTKKLGLPQDAVNFYELYDGVFISWNSKKGIRCKGRLEIPNINSLKKYLTTGVDDNLKLFSKYFDLGWIPFDIDNIFGYATFIVIEKESYKLIRIDTNHNSVELNITIPQYVTLGVQVMGLYHWQNYISQNTFNAIKHYSSDGFFYLTKEKLGINIENAFFNPKLDNFSNSIIVSDHTITLPESIDIIKNRKNSGCTSAEIRKIELSINQKLPKSFMSFLYSKYSLELHWKVNDIESNFKVLNLGQIFGGIHFSENINWKNSYALHLGLHESHEKEYGHFYPFIFEESGHTVFKIENNEILLYFIEDLEPFKIRLTFDQFIKKWSQCAGISGWQRLFVDQYSKSNPEIKNVIQKINTCFPSVDINTFLK